VSSIESPKAMISGTGTFGVRFTVAAAGLALVMNSRIIDKNGGILEQNQPRR